MNIFRWLGKSKEKEEASPTSIGTSSRSTGSDGVEDMLRKVDESKKRWTELSRKRKRYNALWDTKKIHVANKQWDEAIAVCNEMIFLAETSPELQISIEALWADKAKYWQKKGDVTEAQIAYHNALDYLEQAVSVGGMSPDEATAAREPLERALYKIEQKGGGESRSGV